MKDYSVNYYTSLLTADKYEEMVFYLSKGDITKREIIRNTEIRQVYAWVYLNRVNDLNEMIDSLERLKSIKNE